MKTFSGTFANGEKYMGVEVSEDATQFEINKAGCIRYFHNNGNENTPILPDEIGFYATSENCKILGKYHTKGEIDFEPKEEWLKYEFGYINLMQKTGGSLSPKSCLCSLFDRDSRQVFPLEENPQTKPDYEQFTVFKIAEMSANGTTEEKQYIDALNRYFKIEQQVRPKTFLIILVK